MNLRGLVSEIRQSVYAVLVEWAQPIAGSPKIQVLGTAFAVTPNGIFITADHVVNPQHGTTPGPAIGVNDKIHLAQMQVDGQTAVMIGPCTILAASQSNDHAILQAPLHMGRIQKYLELDLEARFEGEEVAICGYPLASTQTLPQNGAVALTLNIRVAAGIISSQQVNNGSKHLEVDFPILPGNSGGPLFSVRSGRVLGLASATFSAVNNNTTIGHLGIIKDIRNAWPDLKRHF